MVFELTRDFTELQWRVHWISMRLIDWHSTRESGAFELQSLSHEMTGSPVQAFLPNNSSQGQAAGSTKRGRQTKCVYA